MRFDNPSRDVSKPQWLKFRLPPTVVRFENELIVLIRRGIRILPDIR